MGILTTPFEELDDDEQIIAQHLINRLHEVDTVFNDLHKRTEKIVQDSARMEKLREELDSLNQEEQYHIPDKAVTRLVKQAQQLDGESKETVALAEQAQVVYQFYVQVAQSMESESLTPEEAIERIKDVEDKIEWIDETDADFSQLTKEQES